MDFFPTPMSSSSQTEKKKKSSEGLNPLENCMLFEGRKSALFCIIYNCYVERLNGWRGW